MAYIAAVAAHPGFTARFQEDLSTPGLRIPLTADPELFAEAVALGRRVIWLHSFGERMADPSQGRPAQPPRLDDARRPTIPKDGAIPDDPEHMPDAIHYDSGSRRLHIGAGFVERVEPAVWNYNVSGKQVILHWFSYRKKKSRQASDRGSAATIAAGIHSTRSLASRIHKRADQPAEHPSAAGGF
jgi:hypothetical protein